KLKNKILLPILADHFGQAIENQELKVVYEAGAFYLEYKSKRLPLNPCTWTYILNPAKESIKGQLGEADLFFIELESILTTIHHLPDNIETDPQKRNVRHREKEVIKKRLNALLSSSRPISEATAKSIQSINGKKGDPHSFNRLEELIKA